ncbi:hypothetical protein MKW92_005399 [Papaver armeniacum]|nr:hypothetical protein MKW92_005399 [Papaver armeniacum]
MCHPCIPVITISDEEKRMMMLIREAIRRGHHDQEVEMVVSTAAAATTSSTTKVQYCLCSPTQHPGSFRCKHHQNEYQWGTNNARNRLQTDRFINTITSTS